MNQDVVIVGAGIAGCVLARQLAADGWRVALVGRPRAASWEGLSPRAYEGFHRVGCRHAAALCATPSPRRGIWNGQPSAANSEFLFFRPDLDAALRADAADAGAQVIEATVTALERTGHGWTAHVPGQPPITATFAVEARGRSALPHAPTGWTGPRTVALARQFAMAAPIPHASGIGSFANGWAWFATFGQSRLVVQLVVDSVVGAAVSHYSRLLSDAVRDVPPLAALLDGATPVDGVSARDATPRLAGEMTGPGFLRLGDAAYAPDPLSGQGIYEAVGGAMTAYRHVTTALTRPTESDVSARFVRERVTERFARLAAVGREFYRGETRWPDRPFWRNRAELDLSGLPSLPPVTGSPSIERRPVAALRGIETRPVVVTADHPRGVWTIAEVPVAALLEEVTATGDACLGHLSSRFHASERQVGLALAWLRHQGALADAIHKTNENGPPRAAAGI